MSRDFEINPAIQN